MYTGKDPGSRARGAAPADAFSEGIIIDPGVLHEEKKASSALTDIYGVPLFTDGYEQNVLRAREEDALAREAEFSAVILAALLAGAWYGKEEGRRKRDADIRHVYGP